MKNPRKNILFTIAISLFSGKMLFDRLFPSLIPMNLSDFVSGFSVGLLFVSILFSIIPFGICQGFQETKKSLIGLN